MLWCSGGAAGGSASLASLSYPQTSLVRNASPSQFLRLSGSGLVNLNQIGKGQATNYVVLSLFLSFRLRSYLVRVFSPRSPKKSGPGQQKSMQSSKMDLMG